jgi:hypothetical protein
MNDRCHWRSRISIGLCLFKTTTGFRVSGTIKQEDLLECHDIAVGNGEEVQTIDLNGKSTLFDITIFRYLKKS